MNTTRKILMSILMLAIIAYYVMMNLKVLPGPNMLLLNAFHDTGYEKTLFARLIIMLMALCGSIGILIVLLTWNDEYRAQELGLELMIAGLIILVCGMMIFHSGTFFVLYFILFLIATGLTKLWRKQEYRSYQYKG